MKNKIFTVLCILFSLMMLNSGLNKFFHYMPMPDLSPDMLVVMGGLMAVKWVMPLVALVEIIASILIVLPKTRALGSLVIFPVMVGIIMHHLVFDIVGLGIPLILFAINIWIILDNWKRFQPIVQNS